MQRSNGSVSNEGERFEAQEDHPSKSKINEDRDQKIEIKRIKPRIFLYDCAQAAKYVAFATVT